MEPDEIDDCLELTDDQKLIELFSKKFVDESEEVSALKQKISNLEAELAKTFKVVAKQNTIIRQYRDIVGTVVHREKPVFVPEKAVVVPEKPIIPGKAVVPEKAFPAEKPSQTKPKQIQPRLIAEEKQQSIEKKRKVEVLAGHLIQEKRIRLPTRERSDGFSDISLAATIWNCIVTFFEHNVNANLMDENMIIRECGRSLLDDGEDALTPEQIHRYFTHPFTITGTDLYMEVRPRFISDKQVWIVFIPQWLKEKWCGIKT